MFFLFVLFALVDRSLRISRLCRRALQDWCRFNHTTTAYIEPGAPWQNPYAESFNGHLRRELLDMESFNTLHEAQLLVEDWRLEYNN
jgi:putative transposase